MKKLKFITASCRNTVNKQNFCKILIMLLLLISAVQISAETRWRGILDTGLEEFRKGQYSFAVTNLKKFLLLSGSDNNKPQALYYLSLSYYFENNMEQSLIYLDELVSKYRLSEYGMQSYFWIGLINQNLQNFQEAETAFKRFISIMPGSDLIDRAYLAAANCQFEQNKYKEALQTLGNIVTNERSEKFEEASVIYAYILLQLNDLENSRLFLGRWIERIASSMDRYRFKDRFWLYMAEIHINTGDDKAAFELLKKIDNYSSGSPSSDIALLRLSEIEYRAGNMIESAEYIKRLNFEYPNSPYNIDAVINQGISLFDQKLYPRAIELFISAGNTIDNRLSSNVNNNERQRLLSLKSKSILYHAEALILSNRRNEAFAILNKIIDNNYPNIEEAVLKNIELSFSGNLSYAGSLISTYERIFANSGRKIRFDILQAEYYFNIGDFRKSNSVIAYMPETDNAALKIRIRNFLSLGETDNALRLLRIQLPVSQPKDRADIIYNMMAINFNKADYQEVIRLSEASGLYMSNMEERRRLSYKIQADYLTGLSFIQDRKYREGIERLRLITAQRDSRQLTARGRVYIANSHYYIGWAYYKLSDFRNASSSFSAASAAIEDNTLKLDSLFMEAWSFYSAQNYKEAVSRFIKIYDDYKPQDSAVRSLLNAAKSYQNMGNTKEANALFFKIYNEHKNTAYIPDALYEIIRYNLSERRIVDANNYINEFTRLYSTHTLYKSVLIAQMEYFMTNERYSEVYSASVNFINNIDESKTYDMIYYWAGFSAMKIRDFQSAVKYFSYLIENFADSTFRENSYRNLIEINRNTRNYKAELELINGFLASFKDEDNYTGRKRILENILLSGVSEEEAVLTSKYQSGDMEAGFNLGVIFYKKGEIQRGLELIEQVRKTDKNRAGALANNFIGDIEFNNDKFREALVIYAATISGYSPDNETAAEALYKTAYCYHKLGSNEQALRILETLNQRFPQSRWKPNAEALMRSIK